MDPGFKGPLAGMASAMRVAQTDWILTVPCDGPLLPTDLAGRLIDAMTSGQTELAAATSGGRIQPVYALLPTGLADELKKEIASGSQKVEQWILGRGPALADFSDQRRRRSANINSSKMPSGSRARCRRRAGGKPHPRIDTISNQGPSRVGAHRVSWRRRTQATTVGGNQGLSSRKPWPPSDRAIQLGSGWCRDLSRGSRSPPGDPWDLALPPW
jgi:hypothetical protein